MRVKYYVTSIGTSTVADSLFTVPPFAHNTNIERIIFKESSYTIDIPDGTFEGMTKLVSPRVGANNI